MRKNLSSSFTVDFVNNFVINVRKNLLRPKKYKKRERIVQLGNAGDGFCVPAQETQKAIQRKPNALFFGVDAKWVPKELVAKHRGWRQVLGDFTEIQRLRDNSVSRISSNLSVFHYAGLGMKPKEYTLHLLKIAYEKLKKGGRLQIVTSVKPEVIQRLFAKTKFGSSKVTISKLNPSEKDETFYTRNYAEELWKVTAVK